MRDLNSKQIGLRTRLRNNQAELYRLLHAYENCGLTIISGSEVVDMGEWLVRRNPKRQATVVASPQPLEQTQTTETSASQPSDTQGTEASDAASEALRQGDLLTAC